MLKKIKQQLVEGKTLLQFGFLKGLGQGLGMVAPLVIAEFFEPDLFGSYSLAKMIVFFFATLLINSLQLAFIVFANQEKVKSGKINRTFSSQCIFFLLSCVFFIAVMGIFNRQVAVFAKINGNDLWFVLLAFLGLAVKNFLCNLFMAIDERIKNSFAEFIFGFFSIALVLFFHLTWELNLRTVLSIYPVSAVLLSFFLIPTIKFRLLLPMRIDVRYIWEMFSFTKWQLIGLTAVYFINWGDNLILRYYDVYMGDIGAYNLAYQLFKGVITLASIVGFYFLPFISQNINDSQKMRDYLYRKRPRVLAFGIAGIVVITLFGWWFLSQVRSGQYKQAVPILMVLIPGTICYLHNTFYLVIYCAAKHIKTVQIFNIIHLTINILLSFALIRYFGLMGAAVATVTAYFFIALIIKLHFSVRMIKNLKM